MNARRLRTSLRGWGGVGAMAVVCALAAVFALLLPVTQSREDGGTGADGQGVAQGAAGQGRGRAWTPRTRAWRRTPAPRTARRSSGSSEDGNLIVGVDQNSYRWGYRDPNSTSTAAQFEGFDIDLVQAIADEILGDEDAEVRFKAIPTSQRIPAIQDGTVDMVVRTMTINCDRLEDVAFSSPYFETGQQVLAPKKSDDHRVRRLAGGASGSARRRAPPPSTGWTRTSRSGDLAGPPTSGPPCRTSSTAWCGCSSARSTPWSPTARSPRARPRRTRRSSSRASRSPTEYYGVAMNKDATDLVRRVNQILVDYRKARLAEVVRHLARRDARQERRSRPRSSQVAGLLQ